MNEITLHLSREMYLAISSKAIEGRMSKEDYVRYILEAWLPLQDEIKAIKEEAENCFAGRPQD